MSGDRLAEIRARLERTGYNPWKDDTFALLAEVERLREYIDRMPYPSDMDQLRAERDRAEAEAARWKAAWDMAEPLLTDLDRAKAAIARVQELVEPFPGQWHPNSEPKTFDQGVGALAQDVLAAIERTDS